MRLFRWFLVLVALPLGGCLGFISEEDQKFQRKFLRQLHEDCIPPNSLRAICKVRVGNYGSCYYKVQYGGAAVYAVYTDCRAFEELRGRWIVRKTDGG